MSRLAAGVFALCVCATATGAPVPKERAEAEKIVGTWRLTLGAMGQTDTHLELDFHQSGKMVIRQVFPAGGTSVYEGTYRIVGNELPYDVKQGTRRKAETLTIKKLTADELIIVDPAGLKEEFVRVKKEEPKKIDPKKLIGKWEQVEPAAPFKFVVECGADGKMSSTITIDKVVIKIVGTYKLDGNKLTLTGKAEGDKNEETEVFTVNKVTDDELIGETSKGEKLLLKRVKEKDKK